MAYSEVIAREVIILGGDDCSWGYKLLFPARWFQILGQTGSAWERIQLKKILLKVDFFQLFLLFALVGFMDD